LGLFGFESFAMGKTLFALRVHPPLCAGTTRRRGGESGTAN